MADIFVQLGAVFLLAFVVALIVKTFKQPIIVGYIIAGVLISPFIAQLGASQEIITIFSEIGIALLLFMVGIHLNPKVIKEMGFSSLLVGIGQILLTFLFGFLISWKLLNFSYISSLYIGIGLTFSSTIIITKLLSDNRKIDTLHGKISVGILILQDLVAIGLLMFISSTSGGESFTSIASTTLLYGAIAIAAIFLFSYLAIPKITARVAQNQELLFLFAIAWCFVLAALFAYLGFSIEIGALIAGITLSISQYSVEIESKIRPLRDFFIIVFFIIIGLNITPETFQSSLIPAIWLSLFALFAKPFIISSLMSISGHARRNNFITGVTMAQISEFSLIVLALGVSVGHIPNEILAMMTMTAIITITISTYFINYSNKMYHKLKFLTFQKKGRKDPKEIKQEYDAILFGHNRIGYNLLESLRKKKMKHLVIDYSPEIVQKLEDNKTPHIYGDAFDSEFLDKLRLDKVKLAISTIPEFEINKQIIQKIQRENKKSIIIVVAHTIKEALNLYELGATYVLTPHFLGGEYVSDLIEKHKTRKMGYNKERQDHIRNLKKRLKEGHEHPKKGSHGR
jgi:Kef-type K+ transport system membrane component KefB/Trk K+ transport system NAD-binding subunit